MTTRFTEQQISDFLAELKRQAAVQGNPKKLSGISWRRLEDIAGPEAYRVFGILEKRGAIRSETFPGLYSHTIYHFA